MSKPPAKSSGQQLAEAFSANESQNTGDHSSANGRDPAHISAPMSAEPPPERNAVADAAATTGDSGGGSPSNGLSQPTPSVAAKPFVSELVELGFADVSDRHAPRSDVALLSAEQRQDRTLAQNAEVRLHSAASSAVTRRRSAVGAWLRHEVQHREAPQRDWIRDTRR
jgi:hypothetical protein